MRKLLISQMITLDGFFARKNGDLDWHMADEEFNRWAIEQLNAVDTLVFGRKTFEMMASYWPTEMGVKDDPEVAGLMNSKEKLAFSKTLDKAEWNNSRIVRSDPGEEIRKLKVGSGKDMVIFGSGQITSALAGLGLIDEYRLLTCPIVLGEGIPLFANVSTQIKLKLASTRALGNGVIMSTYMPA